MYLPMNGGADAYCYTGGKDYDGHRPTVVFIHGAQNDHSVWALQSRYFAHHGYNVLALDLPGHGRSKGPALPSIEEMAGWVLGVMGELGVDMATLVGHSMGSLIALEAAHQGPRRVAGLALLGATYPMKVSDALLESARSEEQVLHKLVAGRFKFAVINEWILDRFNQRMPIGQKLHKVAVIDEQNLGCTVRNDPDVPVQQILRTLLRMKMSGEIDQTIQLYTGETPDRN